MRCRLETAEEVGGKGGFGGRMDSPSAREVVVGDVY